MRRMVVVVVLAACGGGSSGTKIDAPSGGSGDGDGPAGMVLPPVNAPIDYQLGGAYTPPAGVKIVSRDRTASPAAGLYNICYVNGFQIQPDEANEWMTQHADLILRDGSGNPVIDADWKNSSEIVGRKAELGTDFAVSEECNHYNECGDYRAGYGDHVLVIEYVRADFTAGCAAFPGLSIVLRDRNLVTPGSGAYVFDGC